MCLICDDVGYDMIFELCCFDFPSCWFGFKEIFRSYCRDFSLYDLEEEGEPEVSCSFLEWL